MSGGDPYPGHPLTIVDMPKHVAPPPNDLFPRGETPHLFDRSTRWAYRRAQAGVLTTYRLDGDLRAFHSRAEVEALLAPRADA